MLGIIVFLLGSASIAPPARADALGQLCAMAGATDCPSVGTPPPPPTIRRPAPPCPSCAAQAQAERAQAESQAEAELSENLAHMSHPVQATAMSALTSVTLREDVAAANAELIALDEALGLALTVEFLGPALVAGAGLCALNAVLPIRDVRLTSPVDVPIWMNGLSLSSAQPAPAAADCAALEAAQKSACPDAAPCSSDDSCKELLAKRKPHVDCANAWQALKDAKCPADAERKTAMDANAAEVKRCGKLVGGNEECCPKSVKDQKSAACPANLPGCEKEQYLPNSELTAGVCGKAHSKLKAISACLEARVLERERCFGGIDDPGHAVEIRNGNRAIARCGDVIDRGGWLTVCP